MISQHSLLAAEVLNQRDHCQSNIHLYLIIVTNEWICCIHYLRIIRTQITWTQGFHNLYRNLVNFSTKRKEKKRKEKEKKKEIIYWYMKCTTTLTGVNLCFSCSLIEVVHFLQQLQATLWILNQTNPKIQFKEEEGGTESTRSFIEIQMTKETCL